MIEEKIGKLSTTYPSVSFTKLDMIYESLTIYMGDYKITGAGKGHQQQDMKEV